jgi:hypothetical protein
MIGAPPAAPSVPPVQRIVALGMAARTGWVGRKLREPNRAIRDQDRIWKEMVGGFARTAFGRQEGIERGMRYADFRSRLPPRTYEDFSPWIERMRRGERDVLCPGRCRYFAVSSGTTAGRTKYIPVNPEMLAHFRQTALDSLSYYARRVGRSTVFLGRHLFLGGATSLVPLAPAADFQAWSGDLSGITAAHLPRWVERHLYEPGPEIAQLADWSAKLRAIAARTATRNITLLAGIPTWILILAETMRAGTGRDLLQDIWPQLECLVHGGIPLGPFAPRLRAAAGSDVNFHEVYPASEGFIAAQDDEPAAGLRLMTDAGIFFEFLPMSAFDENRLGQLADAIVPLAHAQPGIDYALLLTTPAGLCRYVIGDVVRFVSVNPPRLMYVGRTKLQLSAFGEHVIEKELTDALESAGADLGLPVANFHVAPRFLADLADGRRGCHEWWIELSGPVVPTAADRARLVSALDRELQARNDDYEAKRLGGGLEPPALQIVPPGTFESWMRSRGRWGGQNKMPRCRSDREVADSLERLVKASRLRQVHEEPSA